MVRSFKITDRQREFLPILRKWILSHPKEYEWVMGSRRRDRDHFADVVIKVGVIGEYDDIDRGNLEWITTEYYNWLRKG